MEKQEVIDFMQDLAYRCDGIFDWRDSKDGNTLIIRVKEGSFFIPYKLITRMEENGTTININWNHDALTVWINVSQFHFGTYKS